MHVVKAMVIGGLVASALWTPAEPGDGDAGAVEAEPMGPAIEEGDEERTGGDRAGMDARWKRAGP